jgi:2'-5' RNA ligase
MLDATYQMLEWFFKEINLNTRNNEDMARRIFIAIDISEQARRRVSDFTEQLKKEFSHLRGGWEKPEKLHLTLKFLGDADEVQLEKLKEIVENIAAKISKFTLRIAETGVFPSARNARVLWIDVKDEKGSAAKINQSLETECEKIGFAKEKRNFKPHLTIARVRDVGKSRELAESHLKKEFEPVEFEVAEIVIYESRLQPTGSIYTNVFSSKLKAES